MGNLIPFRKEKEQWVTGEARCMCCTHTWVAVAEAGTTRLECPECRRHKGIYIYEALPEAGLVYECGCGNQLHYITQAGHLCPNCGILQEYE